jgi:integrase
MPYVRSKRHPELFRPSGCAIWYAFLPRKGAGKQPRVSTGHRDEQAAHAWYLERVRGVAARRKNETTLERALERRIEERAAAGRAAGTIDCLTKKARQLVRVLGAETLMGAVDARAVDEYIATRLREDIARSTIYKELVTLRGALKLARRQGYDCLPVDEVMPLSFSPKYRPRERALSEIEIAALLKALGAWPQRQAIVAFLLATGATYPSEVAPLRKGDVDEKKWLVRLRGTKR